MQNLLLLVGGAASCVYHGIIVVPLVEGRVADDILAFIEKWIEDNVAPVDASMIAERAESLAEQCHKDAVDAGFDEEEIEEAVAELADGEGLASYIEAALEKAEEDEEATEED